MFLARCVNRTSFLLDGRTFDPSHVRVVFWIGNVTIVRGDGCKDAANGRALELETSGSSRVDQNISRYYLQGEKGCQRLQGFPHIVTRIRLVKKVSHHIVIVTGKLIGVLHKGRKL